MNNKAYLQSLPKKRMGAGCLFFNNNDQILIVKPSYRDAWLIPGGVVEANESPRQACIREVEEEIGIKCQPEKLLCVDYISETQNNNESLQFIFLGGIISEEEIVITDNEISAYQFLESEKALSLLSHRLRRRVGKCLENLDNDRCLYLEQKASPHSTIFATASGG
ncbi:MAG: NUDIX hydrolase [Xenococcaceae cyanobacterium MO_188.B29]|nr:NUDIX hydrolase [Xenococcaceae cyanobacterium MO_188.B29]